MAKETKSMHSSSNSSNHHQKQYHDHHTVLFSADLHKEILSRAKGKLTSVFQNNIEKYATIVSNENNVYIASRIKHFRKKIDSLSLYLTNNNNNNRRHEQVEGSASPKITDLQRLKIFFKEKRKESVNIASDLLEKM
jgi:hypothetical protein